MTVKKLYGMLYLSNIQYRNGVNRLRNKIAELRKFRDMTQDDLAKMAGVSRPYLSDIENGKYSPGGPLMLRIARALMAPAEEIFFDDDVNHAEQPTGTG